MAKDQTNKFSLQALQDLLVEDAKNCGYEALTHAITGNSTKKARAMSRMRRLQSLARLIREAAWPDRQFTAATQGWNI